MKSSKIYAAFTAVCMMGLLALNAFAAQSLSFVQVVDNVDERKQTKLHAQEFWKSVKSQEVTWSGEVVEVKGGSSKAKIYLADRSRPTYDGYNIIVTTTDVNKAANLSRGRVVRFKGLLDDFSSKKNGAVIKVAEGSLL